MFEAIKINLQTYRSYTEFIQILQATTNKQYRNLTSTSTHFKEQHYTIE